MYCVLWSNKNTHEVSFTIVFLLNSNIWEIFCSHIYDVRGCVPEVAILGKIYWYDQINYHPVLSLNKVIINKPNDK